MAPTIGGCSDIKPTHSMATLIRRLRQRIFETAQDRLPERTNQLYWWMNQSQEKQEQLGIQEESSIDLASPVAEGLTEPVNDHASHLAMDYLLYTHADLLPPALALHELERDSSIERLYIISRLLSSN
jgi:hypothetical protein